MKEGRDRRTHSPGPHSQSCSSTRPSSGGVPSQSFSILGQGGGEPSNWAAAMLALAVTATAHATRIEFLIALFS